MVKQTVTFVVDTERDRDILRWLGSQDNKSAAIREAIREHLRRGGITLTDVYEAIQDLKCSGWTSTPDAQHHEVTCSEEPPDVAVALDCLGL
jgi:hypothetical protein